MKATRTLSRMRDGTWIVRHSSPMLGTVEVSGSSREEALTEMRNELQFRSEWSPCCAASADVVELLVSEEVSPRRQP